MDTYNQDDLKTMIMIRNFELTVLDLFSKGIVKGTTHTCLGQEYIPVSIRPFILDTDFVISNHRGHGHYLALSEDIEGLLSEITGKEGAVCNGIGGSQHIFYNNFMSTGIQGEGIAVGSGIAWSYKHRCCDSICYVYIGDGTFGRGTVYESLNIASLHSLPLVIIVENNAIAMTTPQKANMAGTISARVKAFGCSYMEIESHNTDEIRRILEKPIENVRTGCGPLVVEFKTERIAAHSKGDDTRTKEEIEFLNDRYWYNVCAKESPELLLKCEKEVNKYIDDTLKKVMLKESGVWNEYEK